MLKDIIIGVALAVATAGAAFAQGAQLPQGAQTDAPVRTVVLFSSGVGYFQHAGKVTGDGSTELRFKASQINDVLKSLVLWDLDGGKISTVTYPSQDPIGKTLKSFQVDITGNPSLTDLLNQLRGARVRVEAQAEKIAGTILGVEIRRRPVDKGEPLEAPTLNLFEGATIRSVELDSIRSLVLEDPQLQEELNKALAALSQARDREKKPVTINFAGQGQRRVQIGYVIETPIWKTSYRLILNEKSAKLQGWAIVENQTDSDWNDVQLSLVSGRPISFVMDLYQPLYMARPVVAPELYAGLRPPTYEPGMETARQGLAQAAKAPSMPAPSPSAPAQYRKREAVDVVAESAAPMDAVASVQSIASAAQVGELFQYTVGHVTLGRQKSAMLPIVTDEVEAEKLSIYNAQVLPRNSLYGVRLKNTTGKHLLQGPITVLEQAGYAGDSRIDDLPPDHERLLSYGIDLEMLIDSAVNSQNDSIVTGKIVKGVLEISRKQVASRDYLAQNKSDKDKTLVVEHPVRRGWRLVDKDHLIETTATLYRFKIAIPAAKNNKLTVKEEIVRSETVAILPSDVGQIALYSRTGEIPQNVREALSKAARLKQDLANVELKVESRVASIKEITQEQNRLRENMRAVTDRQSQYYNRLLGKLNEQESQIEKLQVERDTLIKQRDEQRAVLEDYLGKLSIE